MLFRSLGSHHGGSRIVRECYFEAPEYVPLLLACREGWQRLERDSGERIVHRPGVLYAGAADSVVVSQSLQSGQRHGVPFELWTAAEAMRRYPQFSLPTQWHVLFEPGSGFARPERAVVASVRLARALGAQVHEHEPVLDWDETRTGVRVRTHRGQYHAGSLVLTPGAWTPTIAARLGMNAGTNCLGPGNRANAGIGRALQLCLRNIGGARPDTGDKIGRAHV